MDVTDTSSQTTHTELEPTPQCLQGTCPQQNNIMCTQVILVVQVLRAAWSSDDCRYYSHSL